MKLISVGENEFIEWKNMFNNYIFPLFYNTTNKAIRDEVIYKFTSEDVMESGYRYLFIINNVGEKIGTIYYKTKNSINAYINGFYILPQHQHQGYGKEAFNLLEQELILYQYENLYLETRKEYIWATSFYDKLGLEKITTTEELQKHYLGKYYNILAPNTIFYYKSL